MSSLLEQANSKDNREAFLNHLAQASGRKRHQLADHPFKPLNNLPDELLANLNSEGLLATAKKNSVAVNAEVVIKKTLNCQITFINTYTKRMCTTCFCQG